MNTCRQLAAATAAFLVSSAAAGLAQQNPGTPTTQRQPLEVGQEKTGTLTARDAQVGNDHRTQTWAVRGRRGQPLVLDLISTQFDPYLTVVGPGIQAQEDDDGGGACNARVSFTPPEDGIYWVLVQPAGRGGDGEGAFTLRASRTAGPPNTGECGGSSTDRFATEQLAQLPVVGSFTTGDSVRGELTTQDHVLGDSRAKAYDLKGKSGASVTIDLRSRDFDAYLAVTGPGLGKPLTDDDSGGGCDARITFTLPADGPYRVIVTSASSPATGGFVLKASSTASTVEDHECNDGPDPDPDHEHGGGISPDELAQLAVQGSVRVGDDVQGELKTDTPRLVDGTHAEAWTINGKRGETVIVDVVSDAFDGYLLITGPGLADALTDDDAGGACNPRITLTFPADGTYRIVVNTVDRGTTGAFHLKVSAKPGPMANGSCEGGRSR